MDALSSQSELQRRRSRSSQSPKFREARFADYRQIVALRSRYGFESYTYDDWTHLWIDNPLCREFRQWPIGWVLENEEIVGYIGNVPLLYEFEGRRIIVATSRDWVVDSAFRSYSFGLLSRFFAQKHVDLFLNTTVNAYASAGQEAFGASRIPTGTWDQSVFWITEYQGFAASLLAYKGLRDFKLLRVPLSLALILSDRVVKRSSRSSAHNATLGFCTNFDARFDTFWRRLRIFNHHILLGCRSREMLEWRFLRAAAQGRAWILIAEDEFGLVAYAIFLRRDVTKFKLKRLMLIDFEALEDNNELLARMLSMALARCRREGIHMLEVVGFGSEKRRIIDRLAWHRRRLPSWLYFYKAKGEYLANALSQPACWDPSCFDGDASL